MKNGNPIYKLLFKYHVNMIEVCNIRQCLGLISDDKAEQTNKKTLYGCYQSVILWRIRF